MSWKKNARRFCEIQEHGVTVDLPLFNQPAAEKPEPKITTERMPKRVLISDETKAAAFEAARKFIPLQRWRIFSALTQLIEATDRQVQAATGLDINIVCARRRELVQAGLVEKAGETIGGKGLINTTWRINWNKVREITEDKSR